MDRLNRRGSLSVGILPRPLICLVSALLVAVAGARGESWVYWLQEAEPPVIGRTGVEWAVMDYSRDGTDGGRYRRGEIRTLARRGVTALAYVSIGEAEDYRFYWQRAWVGGRNSNASTAATPPWLGRTNPDWRGNYKVRYWDPEWRETVLRPYLDRVLDQGFAGIYLDIVDGFEYWADPASYGNGGEEFRPGDPRGNEADAARRMIELVQWIAETTRRRDRDFLVFPQNGERLVRFDAKGGFLRAVSGIGVEDIFFDEIRPQPDREVRYRMKYLKRFRAAGLPVLCVDYVDNGRAGDPRNADRIDAFLARCRSAGFLPCVARVDRELDRLPRPVED